MNSMMLAQLMKDMQVSWFEVVDVKVPEQPRTHEAREMDEVEVTSRPSYRYTQ